MRVAVASVCLGLAAALLPSSSSAAGSGTTVCRFDDDRFDEISGMTYGQRHPDVLYLHNDSSGGPFVYAVDASTCRTLATLRLAGVEARDIEAIASGRDRRGRPVLWVGDIGDNRDSWPQVRVHRFREPKVLRDRTITVRTYPLTFPEGSVNAEALLADPASTRLWIVSKQASGGTIYALPRRLSRSEVNVGRAVGEAGGLVTDGAVSPDGSRFALRDYVDAEVSVGLPPGTDPTTVYLPLQFQGEALTWTADGTALLVAGERDDRLIRVDLPPVAAPARSPAATGSGAMPTPDSPSGETAGPEAAADARQVTTREGAAGPWLAGLLIAGALGLVASVEWRRRRGR